MKDRVIADETDPCIAHAVKSLGQVAYEAMLATPDGIAAASGVPRSLVLWERQSARVRECWETIAAAIAKAVQP